MKDSEKHFIDYRVQYNSLQQHFTSYCTNKGITVLSQHCWIWAQVLCLYGKALDIWLTFIVSWLSVLKIFEDISKVPYRKILKSASRHIYAISWLW